MSDNVNESSSRMANVCLKIHRFHTRCPSLLSRVQQNATVFYPVRGKIKKRIRDHVLVVRVQPLVPPVPGRNHLCEHCTKLCSRSMLQVIAAWVTAAQFTLLGPARQQEKQAVSAPAFCLNSGQIHSADHLISCRAVFCQNYIKPKRSVNTEQFHQHQQQFQHRVLKIKYREKENNFLYMYIYAKPITCLFLK